MSIQSRKYISKKTGKATIKYYAAVCNLKTEKLVPNPSRATQNKTKIDEAEIIKLLSSGKVIITILSI